jgi:hypothetical protein
MELWDDQEAEEQQSLRQREKGHSAGEESIRGGDREAVRLNVNKKFARSFELKNKRKELTELERRLQSGEVDEDSDDIEEGSEDEAADALDPATDTQVMSHAALCYATAKAILHTATHRSSRQSHLYAIKIRASTTNTSVSSMRVQASRRMFQKPIREALRARSNDTKMWYASSCSLTGPSWMIRIALLGVLGTLCQKLRPPSRTTKNSALYVKHFCMLESCTGKRPSRNLWC